MYSQVQRLHSQNTFLKKAILSVIKISFQQYIIFFFYTRLSARLGLLLVVAYRGRCCGVGCWCGDSDTKRVYIYSGTSLMSRTPAALCPHADKQSEWYTAGQLVTPMHGKHSWSTSDAHARGTPSEFTFCSYKHHLRQVKHLQNSHIQV